MYINVYLKSNSELGKPKFYTNLVVLFFIYFHLNTISYKYYYDDKILYYLCTVKILDRDQENISIV